MPHIFLNGNQRQTTPVHEVQGNIRIINHYPIGSSIFLSEATDSSLQYNSIPITA